MSFKRISTMLALAAVTAAGLASAQGYPSTKPIRLIVSYPPGGGIDFAARTVQVPLQEALKQLHAHHHPRGGRPDTSSRE